MIYIVISHWQEACMKDLQYLLDAQYDEITFTSKLIAQLNCDFKQKLSLINEIALCFQVIVENESRGEIAWKYDVSLGCLNSFCKSSCMIEVNLTGCGNHLSYQLTVSELYYIFHGTNVPIYNQMLTDIKQLSKPIALH